MPDAVARRAAVARCELPRSEWDRLWRFPPELWRAMLADPDTEAAYYRKVYRRRADQCWPWLGAISSTGHGRLRAGSKTAGSARRSTRVVASHVYGFQLSRGLLRPGPGGQMPVIRHRCGEAACHNPAHWVSGTPADNAADYRSRTSDPLCALRDVRGAAGRARAIRNAILAAIAEGRDVEPAIWRAAAAGMRGRQEGPVVTGHRA